MLTKVRSTMPTKSTLPCSSSTATLKLLGRPTAFVAVKDQDHHIMEHDKRIKWQDTIFAWFARYLKSDPTWWNALYPDKAL